jgi:ketosteroid isomerase-like protein
MSHLEALKLDPHDRAAIEALMTEFFDRIDRGPAERLGELFVSDGVVQALDIGVNVKGSQAISEFFAARTRGRGFAARHSWNSLRILEVGDQEVRTSSIIVTYLGARPDGPVKDFSVGNCEDIFRRSPNREWLFLSRNQVKIIS